MTKSARSSKTGKELLERRRLKKERLAAAARPLRKDRRRASA
jgi:hypothetical protein